MVEMEEERLRMREHVMNEVCFKSFKICCMDYEVVINFMTKWKTNKQNWFLLGFLIQNIQQIPLTVNKVFVTPLKYIF